MAIQAVNGVTDATPITVDETGLNNGQKDYTKMTAKEIIEANKNGETVPANILSWAEENPESKTTFAESQQDGGIAGEETDTVSYKDELENSGYSLRQQSQILTALSRKMEERDLNNITKMGPYMQQVPTDEQTGDSSTNEVTKALDEISKDMKGGSFFSRAGRNNLIERAKFYKALNEGTSGELDVIDFSLEEIQSVLDRALSQSKESKQAGSDSIEAGQELKSESKWFRFRQRKIANKAIEQGDKTVKMSERTDKLAQAVAKDNGVALKSTKDNIQTVEGSVLEEEQATPDNSTPTTPGADTGTGTGTGTSAGTGSGTGPANPK